MKTISRYLLASTIVLSGLSQPFSAQASAASDLAYYLPPGEVVWLRPDNGQDSDDEQDEVRYLLLERDNHLAYDRGSIVLIPELGTHPYQSTTIRTLYQSMNDYGWYTYALQPPTVQVTDILWQEENGQRYPSGLFPADLQSQLAERLRLALEHARQQPGALIIIAEGVSAALVIDLLTEDAVPHPDALVVSGVHYPQWQMNRTLATTLAQLPIVTLDLASGGVNRWVEDTHELRRQQAQRHQHIGYRQRILPAGRHAEQPRFLPHTVYGWLRYEDF